MRLKLKKMLLEIDWSKLNSEETVKKIARAWFYLNEYYIQKCINLILITMCFRARSERAYDWSLSSTSRYFRKRSLLRRRATQKEDLFYRSCSRIREPSIKYQSMGLGIERVVQYRYGKYGDQHQQEVRLKNNYVWGIIRVEPDQSSITDKTPIIALQYFF